MAYYFDIGMMQRTKHARRHKTSAIQGEGSKQPQDAKAIANRTRKADRAGLGEITMRHRDFLKTRPERDRLRDDLLVEDEIV